MAAEVDQGVTAMTRVTKLLLHHFLDFKFVMAVVFFVGLGLTYLCSRECPRVCARRRPGIFHHRGSGALGASLEYTKAIGKQIADILGIAGSGGNLFDRRLQLCGSAPNQGLIFVPLKPYSQRKGEQHGPGDREPGASAAVRHSGAIVFATAARDPRIGAVRRISVRGAGPGQHIPRRTGRRTAGTHPARRRQRKDLTGLYTPSPRTIRNSW